MRRRTMGIAAVVMAAGMMTTMAPAASAQTTTVDVPCETIFGETVCAQIRDTGQFVNDTVGRLGPAIEEWRDIIAREGQELANQVFCIISGDCWPLAIHP